jgi:hypothetical protein
MHDRRCTNNQSFRCTFTKAINRRIEKVSIIEKNKLMAEQRKARSAALGARTRERNRDLRGPSTHRSAREVEAEREERGCKTLTQAYAGVPSRSDFLKRADLFEYIGTTDRIKRAFIVPDDSVDAQGATQLYWYRRNTSVSLPRQGESFAVTTIEGDKYTVTSRTNIAAETRVHLKGTAHTRTCTGEAMFIVARVV